MGPKHQVPSYFELPHATNLIVMTTRAFKHLQIQAYRQKKCWNQIMKVSLGRSENGNWMDGEINGFQLVLSVAVYKSSRQHMGKLHQKPKRHQVNPPRQDTQQHIHLLRKFSMINFMALIGKALSTSPLLLIIMTPQIVRVPRWCSRLNLTIISSVRDLCPADCEGVALRSRHGEKVSQEVDVGLKGRGPDHRPGRWGTRTGTGTASGVCVCGGGGLFNNPRLILRLRLQGKSLCQLAG